MGHSREGIKGTAVWKAKSHQQRLELELEELRKWKVEAQP